MKKQIISTIYIALCTSIAATAQNIMVLEMSDKTAHEFNLEDIRKIIFSTSRETPNDSITYHLCPDDHHPHMVDLGLPSGTMWACCNVGASMPEESGGYYSWGEIEEKETYFWIDYLYFDSNTLECADIGDDIAGTGYDVAHVKWGEPWRMPTTNQLQELKNNCIYEWMSLGEVNGYLFTSQNGGELFLPAAGGYFEDWFLYEGVDGYYWSSSASAEEKELVVALEFRSPNYLRLGNGAPYAGYSVRPCCLP